MRRQPIALLVAALAAAPRAHAQTSDGFEGGVNHAGWTFGVVVPDVIETSGGSPGAWLHNSGIDSFTAILTSGSGACFVGDLRASRVDMISVDARTDGATFGAGGRQMSLLLRDTKGTPVPDDDDYAYFVGPLVPQVGAGWVHYDFPVPSQSTVAVPPGWTGGWAGDATHFRPGVDWNDVITSVDRVELWWQDPSLFAIFQQWDVGVDDVELHVAASSTPRNGGGANPAGMVETTPAVLGGTWTLAVDVATPGALASLVAIGTSGPLSGVTLTGLVHGEVLVLPPIVAVDVAVGSHALSIPADCSLLGRMLYAQGATFAPGDVALNNAIDAVVGTP